MDKFRAWQYFVAAASHRSFSAAARELAVSAPAVLKLIGALERDLGARLFDRSAQGLALTADGARYLDAIAPALSQLDAASVALRSGTARVGGTLVVGATPQIAQYCLLPALPQFHLRYPELRVDLRGLNRLEDADARGVDVFVLLWWQERADWIQKQIATVPFLICAAPNYWAAHGAPRHPRDLKEHTCLMGHTPQGMLIDLWEFARGDERESVTVGGWFSSNQRDLLLHAALAGEGVARISPLTARPLLTSGRLVPVLTDWQCTLAPPVHLMYRPQHRRLPRVRVFVDWATVLFAQLEVEREVGLAAGIAAQRPSWYWKRVALASGGVDGPPAFGRSGPKAGADVGAERS